jgi:hypothetical protein
MDVVGVMAAYAVTGLGYATLNGRIGERIGAEL